MAKLTSPTDRTMERSEKEAVDGVSPKPHASEEASDDVDEHMKPSAESKNEEEAPEEDSDGCNGPDGHLIDHRNDSKQQWDGTSTNLIFVM